MPNRRTPLPEDFQRLIRLIQLGRIFDLQHWIETGGRLRASDPAGCDTVALTAAVRSGIHSAVQVLLEAGGWGAACLAEGLELALDQRRPDLADLLLKHGAQLPQISFYTLCTTLDLPLMERFLREGGNPSHENAFAYALSSLKARPLLRFYKQFRSEFPALDDQAALALYDAVDKQQVRWTALLTWAGADPFRPVPWSMEEEFPVQPEDSTCAATKAAWRGTPDIIKVLHLKPTPAQALALLDDAAYNCNIDLFRALLKAIPRDQVNAPQDSCSALEKLVAKSLDRNIWTITPTGKGEAENLQCVELLLDVGARWNPPSQDLRYSRRWLIQHDGRYLSQLIRLLLYTPNAADPDKLTELCQSQKLQAKLAEVDPDLSQDLKRLRKERAAQRRASASIHPKASPGPGGACPNASPPRMPQTLRD